MSHALVGDLVDAFFVAPGRCFRMVLSDQLQATHCPKPVVWRGGWTDVKGKRWVVEACEKHAPKAAGQGQPGG